MKQLKNNKYLFLITLLYFALGFVNIHFALLGLVCMVIPFILLFKDKKKTWCQGYCPRASLYTNAGKLKRKNNRKTPNFFVQGNMKWFMLFYFGISLLAITISTIKVANGSMAPMYHLRFLLVIPLSSELPQLFDFGSFAPWITHLAYRFYSMIMTTTFLGLLLALFYKPRTWCTICPISTASELYLKQTKSKTK